MWKSRRTIPCGLVAAAVVTVSLMTGCSVQDNVCTTGEYPVKAVDSFVGAACVSNGEEPPEGYVRYPKGKVPQHVDDKWDKYWSTRAVDENGNVVREDTSAGQ